MRYAQQQKVQKRREGAETPRRCRDTEKVQRRREGTETPRRCSDAEKVQKRRQTAETPRASNGARGRRMRYAQQHELCNSKARTTRERPTQRTMQCALALEQRIARAVCTGTTHCQSSVRPHRSNAKPGKCWQCSVWPLVASRLGIPMRPCWHGLPPRSQQFTPRCALPRVERHRGAERQGEAERQEPALRPSPEAHRAHQLHPPRLREKQQWRSRPSSRPSTSMSRVRLITSAKRMTNVCLRCQATCREQARVETRRNPTRDRSNSENYRNPG